MWEDLGKNLGKRFWLVAAGLALFSSSTPAADPPCPYATLVEKIRVDNIASTDALDSAVRSLSHADASTQKLVSIFEQVAREADKMFDRQVELRKLTPPEDRSGATRVEETRLHNLVNAALAAKAVGSKIREKSNKGEPITAEEVADALVVVERLHHLAARNPMVTQTDPTSVHSLLSHARAILQAQDVKVQTKGPELDHVVKVDEGQILEIIDNLSVNASRHAFHGVASPELSLTSTYRESVPAESREGVERMGTIVPGKPYLEIELRDNGLGMDAATLKRIFESGVTGDAKQGRGLGLASVAEMAKNNGGAVEVSSSTEGPNRGTTFRLLLPMEAMPEAAKKEAESPMKRLPFSKARELVVIDDNSANTEMTVMYLDIMGVKGAGFASSTEAFDAFTRDGHQPKVVLLDYNIPGDKLSFEKKVEMLQAAGIEVILSSGEHFTPERLAELKIKHVHQKGEDPDKLIEKVSAIIAAQGE